MSKASVHGMWSSRTAFILAATGSAVGLGNIWRFPYMVSDNGGSAFVLIYLFCIVVVGLPILMAELAIGRHGRQSPVNSLQALAEESQVSTRWKGAGWVGLLAGVVILSFYSIVGGWTLRYTWLYLQQLLGGSPITDATATFNAMVGSPALLSFWHVVFMAMTLLVVAVGVQKGLERAVKLLMPALFVLLLVLIGYSATTGHLGTAAGFMFAADFSAINGNVWISAMGQAFFSLSLGMGTMVAYGAYLPDNVSIPRVAISVVIADTLVALLAGMAIFPIVIGFGLDPAGGGPGLIFNSLPLAFQTMPFGLLYGLLFFALLATAAWTSSISLLEPATAYLVERTRLSRPMAAACVAGACLLMGMGPLLSLNLLANFKPFGRDLMDLYGFIGSDILLPVGGVLLALFSGWRVKQHITRSQLQLPPFIYTVWLWLVRVVSPALVLLVMWHSLR